MLFGLCTGSMHLQESRSASFPGRKTSFGMSSSQEKALAYFGTSEQEVQAEVELQYLRGTQEVVNQNLLVA